MTNQELTKKVNKLSTYVIKIKPELKHRYVTWNTSITTLSRVNQQNNPVQGDSVSTRSGDTIRIMKMEIGIVSDTGVEHHLINDYGVVGSPDFLAAGPTEFGKLNPDIYKTYRTKAVEALEHSGFTWNVKFPKGLVVTYQSGTTTPVKNSLLIYSRNHSATTSDYSGFWRIYYYDS